MTRLAAPVRSRARLPGDSILWVAGWGSGPVPQQIQQCWIKQKTEMAHPKGFEPLASAFGGQRSIQLSYGCVGCSA